MKLTPKSFISILLLGIVSYLFFKWWLTPNSQIKKENIELRRQIKEMDKKRDSLEKENITIQKKNDSISINLSIKESRVNVLNTELDKNRRDLILAKNDVSKYKVQLDSMNNRVSYIINNPIKRYNDDLINSLKEKLK